MEIISQKLKKLVYVNISIGSSLIDFSDKNFIQASFLTLLSIICITLLPHLQYRYRFISKMTGDDMGRAADFLAYFLIHIGSLKTFSFFEALFSNKRIEFEAWFYYSVFPFSIVLIIVGLILVLFSFQRLGLRGMYFGDHFGFLMKGRIKQFPYNILENPQYIGSNLIYLGFSVATRSPAGLLLSLFSFLAYKMFFVLFEEKKLKVFYPYYEKEEDEDDKTEQAEETK